MASDALSDFGDGLDALIHDALEGGVNPESVELILQQRAQAIREYRAEE